jgi:hypothetical protein
MHAALVVCDAAFQSAVKLFLSLWGSGQLTSVIDDVGDTTGRRQIGIPLSTAVTVVNTEPIRPRAKLAGSALGAVNDLPVIPFKLSASR